MNEFIQVLSNSLPESSDDKSTIYHLCRGVETSPRVKVYIASSYRNAQESRETV